MDEALIERLKGAKSVEEILSYAKESGVSLTEEQAKEIFAQVSVALSDDDLEEVAGGAAKRPAFLKMPWW